MKNKIKVNVENPEDSGLLRIAKKEFKGGVFHASNGIWLCFWVGLSYVRYV